MGRSQVKSKPRESESRDSLDNKFCLSLACGLTVRRLPVKEYDAGSNPAVPAMNRTVFAQVI